jgi:hypothetical protein
MKRYTVDPDRVKATIKHILRKGNVTRLRITTETGKELVNLPVTVAGIAVFAAPFWIGLGVALAFVKRCHIDVVTED